MVMMWKPAAAGRIGACSAVSIPGKNAWRALPVILPVPEYPCGADRFHKQNEFLLNMCTEFKGLSVVTKVRKKYR